MKRVLTAVTDSPDPAADYNEIEDRVAGMLAANVANDYATTKSKGVDERTWTVTAPGTVANNGFPVIDDSIDWRDRYVEGWLAGLGAATDRPGQSTDYNFNEANFAGVLTFRGYTGSGSYGDNAGAPVDAVNAPFHGAGVPNSYAINIDGVSGTLFLYVDPSNGKLGFYNNTGGAVSVVIWVRATGPLGKR